MRGHRLVVSSRRSSRAVMMNNADIVVPCQFLQVCNYRKSSQLSKRARSRRWLISFQLIAVGKRGHIDAST